MEVIGRGHPIISDVNASKGRSAKEWMRTLPSNIDWSVWHEPLPSSFWAVIDETNELEAETLLLGAAAVPLTGTQLTKFAHGRAAEGMPFLVRGVGATWDTKGFEIKTSSQGELWVGCERLSRRTVPIERRPVVVWLERAPTQVYVTFGVYE